MDDLKKNGMEHFGRNIRKMRQKRGWSLKETAGRIGISIAAVSKIETGVTDINLSRLEQVADVFGVDVVELLVKNGKGEGVSSSFYSTLQKKLLEREAEVLSLQRKIIDLYEEIQNGNRISHNTYRR